MPESRRLQQHIHIEYETSNNNPSTPEEQHLSYNSITAEEEEIMQHSQIPPPRSKILLHSCCAPCSGAMVEEMIQKMDLDVTIFFYNPNIHPKREYEIRKEENKKHATKFNIPFVDCDYDAASWHQRMAGLELEPERGMRCSACFDMRCPSIHLYTPLYTSIPLYIHCTSLYSLYLSIFTVPLYIHCTPLYSLYPSVPLYTPLYSYTPLYIPIHHYIPQYIHCRMEVTAMYAYEQNFQYFTTTNATSRWKDQIQVNLAGIRAARLYDNDDRVNDAKLAVVGGMSVTGGTLGTDSTGTSPLEFWVYNWQSDEMTRRKYEVSVSEKFYKQEYCGCSHSLRDSNVWRQQQGIPVVQIGVSGV